jgi:hypothetical protein
MCEGSGVSISVGVPVMLLLLRYMDDDSFLVVPVAYQAQRLALAADRPFHIVLAVGRGYFQVANLQR